jgi:hypothetical protein
VKITVLYKHSDAVLGGYLLFFGLHLKAGPIIGWLVGLFVGYLVG